MKKLLITLSLVILHGAVMADEPKTPIEKFRGQTQYQSLICDLEAKLAFGKVDLGEIKTVYEPIGKCLNDGKLAVKTLFPKALASAAKKPSSVKLLKDYYAAWLTAFNSISPRADDRVVDYKSRQAIEESKVNAAWNRFEIEFEM